MMGETVLDRGHCELRLGCGPSSGPSAQRCLPLRQAQSLSPISSVHEAQRGVPPQTLRFLGPGSPFPPSSGQPSLLTHYSRVTPASARTPLPPRPLQPPSAGQPWAQPALLRRPS